MIEAIGELGKRDIDSSLLLTTVLHNETMALIKPYFAINRDKIRTFFKLHQEKEFVDNNPRVVFYLEPAGDTLYNEIKKSYGQIFSN